MNIFLEPKLWLAVSFSIFLILVIKYILPIIIRILDKKSQEIAENIKNAQQMKNDAQELLRKTKEIHEETIKNSKKIIEQAQEEARKLIYDAQQALDEEVHKKTNLAKERIQTEEEKAMREIKISIIKSAIDAAKKESIEVEQKTSINIIKNAIDDVDKMIN